MPGYVLKMYNFISLVNRTLGIPSQSMGQETSFLISCNASCEGVDVKVKGSLYDTGYYLFALEGDKPTMDSKNASCAKCADFCSSSYDYTYAGEKACRNLSTSDDKFFVTIYARYSHQNLTIEVTGRNILKVSETGIMF